MTYLSKNLKGIYNRGKPRSIYVGNAKVNFKEMRYVECRTGLSDSEYGPVVCSVNTVMN
jgi:hypothetical protein